LRHPADLRIAGAMGGGPGGPQSTRGGSVRPVLRRLF
jgi:hypothetical protein